MDKSLGQMFLQGGMVMWPLLILSIATWAIVLERTLVFLVMRPRFQRLTQSLLQSLRNGDAATAKQICHAEKPEVAELFLCTLDTRRNRPAAERLTDRARARMALYLKKNLWALGTIGSASPFIGLLGTVVGILHSFHKMASEGTGGFSVVAAGISEALIATAAGLIVAIIALFAYNIFTTIANQTMMNLKLTLDELLDESFVETKAKG